MSTTPTTTPTTTLSVTLDAPDTNLRRTGWQTLRALRGAIAEVNATIVAALRTGSGVAVRVAPVTTLDATMGEARALMTLPSVLAGPPSGILTALACADAYGDPQRGEIIIGAEALSAFRAAEIALDDALAYVRLAHQGSHRMRYGASDYARALCELAEAIIQAQRASARARQLSADLQRLPMYLRIATGALPATPATRSA